MIQPSKNTSKKNLISAALLLIVGIAFANVVAWQQQIKNQIELQVLFDEEAKNLVNSILSYVETYKYGLLGVRGVVLAHGDNSISRKTFKNYSASRNMEIEFPGALGFGFIRKVARENEALFLKQARADDMPDFAIKDFTQHNGDHYIIQYIEPAGRNRPVLGLDIASESSLRNDARQAMQTGEEILTSPITLVQASGLTLRSFILLLPIYHLDMPLDTVKQREAATLGWSFAPIVINDLLQHTGAVTAKQMNLQITDIRSNKRMLPFYSPADFEDLTRVSLKAQFRRTIFGRTWEFKLQAQPDFYRNHERLSPLWLAGFIVSCAFFLSVLLYFYLTYRQQLIAKSQEQKRLAAIVASARDAIISLDLNGVVTSWNNAADLMFDFSAADAIGKQIYDLIIPDDKLKQKKDFLNKIRHGEFIPRHDTVRKTRDGRLIDVSVISTPIFDSNHQVIGAAKTIIDITEQKRIQELFRLVTEAVPDAIITINDNNIITLVNEQVVELFGYLKEELLGQNIRKLIPVFNREQHEEHTKQFHSAPYSRHQGMDLFILHKNGCQIPVEIQLSPFKIQNENFVLAAISDLRLRKQLESELQNWVARMKMAVSSLNLGIWEWQLADNKLIWDERMFEIYDAPKSLAETGLYHDFWRSCVHPDDFDYVEKKLLGHLAGTDVFNFEFRIVRSDGEIRYIQAATIVERNVQGEPTKMVGINFDITERKQHEDELLKLTTKSELKVIERTQEFLDLYNEAPCGYHSLDPQGKILRANQTELAFMGYAREEYIGHRIVDFMSPESEAAFQHNFPELLRTGRLDNIEVEFLRKDGGVFSALLSSSLIRNAQGQVLHTNTTMIDNRELKAREQKLIDLNKFFGDVLEVLPFGVVVYDEEQRAIFRNSLFSKILNYPQELSQKEPFFFADSIRFNSERGDYQNRTFDEVFTEFLNVMKNHDNLCFVRQQADNGAFLEIRHKPLFNGWSLIIYSDITQHKLDEKNLETAKQTAETATRAKTDFLANMSHEIRTPINAVIGLAYLLLKNPLLPEERNIVNKIDVASQSLLGIINSCLDFSKIESDHLTLEQTPFQLADIFDNLSNIMSSAAGEKNVELLIAPIPKDANYLIGDSTRLGQILVNLVGNAIKFTNQGEVIVNVKVVQQDVPNNQVRLRFSVIDTGVGIPLEKQETIFQPFSQADTSTTRIYGGTGLGLSISRHLVELMGGQLQIHSQMDVGSEFFFELTFPISETGSDAGSHLIADLAQQNLLIVDDNPTACSMLKAMVQDLGWNAYTVNSGEKALQVISEQGANYFDLLLIDWKMPGIDGLQTAVEINTRLGKELHPIIIMVTAYDRITLLEHPSSQFIDAFVSKPVTSSSLFDVVLEVKAKKGKLTSHNSNRVDGKRLKGLNILVVDDNEINREVACQIINDEGATVEMVENGQEALLRLMANPEFFHVVLMDVQMPVMDGYAATRKIRSIASLKHLPIIALTAGIFKSQRDAAFESGMDDFVGKPFEVDELVACVERFSGRAHGAKAPLAIMAETVAPAELTNFTALPLIDVANGLKKWGDAQMYQKYLRIFVEKNSEIAVETQQALLNNDVKTAKAITHTLLGSGGNLALKRLVQIIAKIEAAFNSNENPQEQYLVEFEKTLVETIAAINSYLVSETPTISTTPEKPTVVSCSKKELLQLIDALDTDNPALIEPKLYDLTDKLPAQQFDDLVGLINNFNFRGAEVIVKKLFSELTA